jgi:hypothetical protein
MKEWIKVKSQEELKKLPNGTRIRYVWTGDEFGYGSMGDGLRFIRHEEHGTSTSFTIEKTEDGVYGIGSDDFHVSKFSIVEYHVEETIDDYDKPKTNKKSIVDTRSDDEKVIADILLG